MTRVVIGIAFIGLGVYLMIGGGTYISGGVLLVAGAAVATLGLRFLRSQRHPKEP